jgi:hypothetical protein
MTDTSQQVEEGIGVSPVGEKDKPTVVGGKRRGVLEGWVGGGNSRPNRNILSAHQFIYPIIVCVCNALIGLIYTKQPIG